MLRFHVETGTFHLSYKEYAVLLLDWTTILGIRFGGLPIPTEEISFKMARELLGIPLPLTVETRGYFGPTMASQIRIEWLQSSIPWDVAPTNIQLRQFFLWFLSSCFFSNNRSVLTCQLLWARGVVYGIGTYDLGSVTYGFFITFLRRAFQQDFRSIEGCWQILMWWAYEYIPTLRPWYIGLSVTTYTQAYAWALCRITRVVAV